MIIEQPLQVGQPRRKVWCSMEDIELVEDGVYQFINLPLNALGYGSQVNIIDNKLILLYDDNTGLLYDWTDGLYGGEPE